MRLPYSRTLSAIILLSTFSAHAVINGNIANEHKFSAVGSLRVIPDKTVACTATVIASKWIVTADHCTHATEGSEEEGGAVLPASAYEFRLGNDFNSPIFKTNLKRWVRIPNFKEQAIDLAFAELAIEIPLAKLQIKTVRPINQVWTSEELKLNYIHIGYGSRQAFGQPDSAKEKALINKRQKATFQVTSVSENALVNIFSTEANLESYINQYHPEINLEVELIETILSHGQLIEKHSVHAWDPRGRQNLNQVSKPQKGWQDTCYGDSGGPLLREKDGVLRIVGVVSQGMNGTCATLGTRFTTFGPQVIKVMKSLKLHY